MMCKQARKRGAGIAHQHIEVDVVDERRANACIFVHLVPVTGEIGAVEGA